MISNRAIIVAIVGLAMAASAAMGRTMTDREATRHLLGNGISVVTSGRYCYGGRACEDRYCSYKGSSSCTSLDGIRATTIWQLIAFKNLSGCPNGAIVVIGGTEDGHGSYGHTSYGGHERGHKVDIRLHDCIQNFINTSWRFPPPEWTWLGPRYKTNVGNEYLKENDHWDINYEPTNN